MITDVEEFIDNSTESKLLFVTDLLGKIVANIETFEGIAILHFEDGSRKKVIK